MSDNPTEFEARWSSLLKERGGQELHTPDATFLFRFANESETAKLIEDWSEELGLRDLFLIGNFGTGDLVCAHRDGKLFVVLHDTFEWWDSDVSLDEFLTRLDSGDEALEEEVYSPPHRNSQQQRWHPGTNG